jgi:polysaccharide biosynthesis transport protein
VSGRTGDTSALVHYLRVLRRGAWLVVLATALLATAAVLLSLRQQRLYQASADVFLTSQDIAASLANVQLPYVDPVREAANQADLAQTPAVAARAARLAHIPGLTGPEIAGSVAVTTAASSDLLTFSSTRGDPKQAALLANVYARAYTAYRRELDTASLVRARHQVEQRMAELVQSASRGSAIYADLAAKDQQLRTLEVLQGSNALLVRPADGAVQTQPKPTRNGVLGGVLGFMLGLGLAFLADALNTRVRSPAEIEERLALPLLARLPEPTRKLRGVPRLVMIDEPNAPAAEAYRILATNLDFVNLDRGARTIMVTSATRAEGKSTTIANLAVALARTGRRIVLVDLDLRKPSLDEFFDLGDQPGLTRVVLGRATLEEAIVRVPIADAGPSGSAPSSNGAGAGWLEILPTGPLPPNPAEFASSHALDELFGRLTAHADLVLVDAPPLLRLSDSIALSAKVDALIVVTRLSDVRRSTLEELRRTLESVPVINLGFIVTGMKSGEGFGYGYGYGYGYGEAKTRQRREAERERVS